MKKEWWHNANVDGSVEIKCFGPGDPYPGSGNGFNWGPFETFSEAKADAISYFQTDINNARAAIQDLRAMRKPKD